MRVPRSYLSRPNLNLAMLATTPYPDVDPDDAVRALLGVTGDLPESRGIETSTSHEHESADA